MTARRSWETPQLWELGVSQTLGAAACQATEGGHVVASAPSLTFHAPTSTNFPCAFPPSGVVGPAARGMGAPATS